MVRIELVRTRIISLSDIDLSLLVSTVKSEYDFAKKEVLIYKNYKWYQKKKHWNILKMTHVSLTTEWY